MYSDGRILSQRIWSAEGRLQGGIEEILAQGIAQQQSTYQIARALEAYVNPKAACPTDWRNLYPDTPFEMKVDYNATRLARTAINHVYWQTGINAARENPFCKAMHWELSDAHYERQVAHWGEDVCDEYARHEEGLGRGNFPIDQLPRPHPNCLCIQWEVLPEPEEAAERFKAWMNGAEDPALDRGFEKFVQTQYGRKAAKIIPEASPQVDKSTKNGTMDLQIFAETDIQNQESASLKRAIRKYERRIAEHQMKIDNPESHCENWNEFDVRRQNGLKKHWQKEIQTFRENIQARTDELKRRGDYDD